MSQTASAATAGRTNEQAVQAFGNTLNKRLERSPITISDGGKTYAVKSFKDGRFDVTETNPTGTMVTAGGIEHLECNEHYLGLILDKWNDQAGEAVTV